MGRISARVVALLLALLPVAAGATAEIGTGATPRWRFDSPPMNESGALAVAVSADAREAVGDGRGVWLRESGGDFRRLDLRGAVRDLAFAPDGALWIASDQGLARFADGRLVFAVPAPGDENRDVRRVAAIEQAIAVVTAGGVFWSRDGVRFARVEAATGENPAAAIALEVGSDAGVRLWIATERGLLVATLVSRNGAAVVRAARVELPFALRPALDVAIAGARLLALGRTDLLERADDGTFQIRPTELPPGATPVRVAAGDGVVLIATDRGLVVGASAAGPWQRATAPAGTGPLQDVAIAGDIAFVAGARGVLVGDAREAIRANAAPAAATRAISCDPPILEVQRAALRYLHLSGDPAGAMRRGVRLRGLLPIVSLKARKGHGGDTRRSYDESFVSGLYHKLNDRDDLAVYDRDVELGLSWDLGDTVYNPEQIDVSTEARRLIELRDDVLDELDQLYFDRRRALDGAAVAPDGSPEAARERLRAEELAAGLDAWTDGWFARSAACPRP
jgi:hypothetical protein